MYVHVCTLTLPLTTTTKPKQLESTISDHKYLSIPMVSIPQEKDTDKQNTFKQMTHLFAAFKTHTPQHQRQTLSQSERLEKKYSKQTDLRSKLV